MKRQWLPLIAPLAFFVPLVIVLAVGLHHAPDKNNIPSPLIGRTAPVFSLPDLMGGAAPVSNATLAGRWTLVNVWGTWCGECRVEHEALLAIQREGRVPIIGIDWKDEDGAARAFLAEYGNPWEHVGADRDGRAAIDWGVYGAPESFLVSPTGKVVYKHIGAMSEQVWQTRFLPLIGAAGQAGGS